MFKGYFSTLTCRCIEIDNNQYPARWDWWAATEFPPEESCQSLYTLRSSRNRILVIDTLTKRFWQNGHSYRLYDSSSTTHACKHQFTLQTTLWGTQRSTKLSLCFVSLVVRRLQNNQYLHSQWPEAAHNYSYGCVLIKVVAFLWCHQKMFTNVQTLLRMFIHIHGRADSDPPNIKISTRGDIITYRSHYYN